MRICNQRSLGEILFSMTTSLPGTDKLLGVRDRYFDVRSRHFENDLNLMTRRGHEVRVSHNRRVLVSHCLIVHDGRLACLSLSAPPLDG
jgi:hypothetical protein